MHLPYKSKEQHLCWQIATELLPDYEYGEDFLQILVTLKRRYVYEQTNRWLKEIPVKQITTVEAVAADDQHFGRFSAGKSLFSE
jgi:hypothetical protein